MSHVQTVATWRASTKGKAALDAAARVEVVLRVYHAKAGTEIEERRMLLQELAELARAHLKDNAMGTPYYGLFLDLGMQADKQLASMDKATKAWGAARKIFGASGSPHGKSNALQHYKAGEATPTSQQNYWLEGLDPKHRSWGHMDPKFFADWVADTSTTKGFFDWLEDKNLAQNLPQVQYLAPDERWKYMCVFGDDKIMYRHQAHLGAPGAGKVPLERFTTWGLETAHSGRNYAIWVCSPGGIFYSNVHKVSEFHHSTFLAGGRVLAAGEWVVTAGKLLLISHKTGHHAASPENLYRALKLLETRLDISRTVVHVRDFAAKADKFVTATEFIAKNGNPSSCAPITDHKGMLLDMKTEAQKRCDAHVDWDGRHATKPRQFA